MYFVYFVNNLFDMNLKSKFIYDHVKLVNTVPLHIPTTVEISPKSCVLSHHSIMFDTNMTSKRTGNESLDLMIDDCFGNINILVLPFMTTPF